MSGLSHDARLAVRTRAQFACEFCGVTETDSAGELTLDHFQPKAKDGPDNLDNLIYCCVRCNQYKADYWPSQSDELMLWNPRQEPLKAHLLTLADGTLYPITPIGQFTINRLRLNREQLVAYRLRKRQQQEETQLLMRYREFVLMIGQLYEQEASLLEDRKLLLAQQQELLRLLLGK